MPQNSGMDLEQAVFQWVQELLDAGELPYRKELCRLHRDKSYYSSHRDGNINFENVLEAFLPEAIDNQDAQPTHVVFFECKDHGRPIEVGRIDEIVGRMNASHGFSMKAYVVTRNRFSKGAINTARQHGIGLIKFMPDNQVRHVLYQMTEFGIKQQRAEFPQRVVNALLNADFESDWETFYGCDGNAVFDSLKKMLKHAAGA